MYDYLLTMMSSCGRGTDERIKIQCLSWMLQSSACLYRCKQWNHAINSGYVSHALFKGNIIDVLCLLFCYAFLTKHSSKWWHCDNLLHTTLLVCESFGDIFSSRTAGFNMYSYPNDCVFHKCCIFRGSAAGVFFSTCHLVWRLYCLHTSNMIENESGATLVSSMCQNIFPSYFVYQIMCNAVA